MSDSDQNEYTQTDDSGTTTGREGMGSLGHGGGASTKDTAPPGGERRGPSQEPPGAPGRSPRPGDTGQGDISRAPNRGTSTAERTDPSLAGRSGGQDGDGGGTGDTSGDTGAEDAGSPTHSQPRGYGSQSGHGMDSQAGAASLTDADRTGGYDSGGLGDDPVSRRAQAGQQSQGAGGQNTGGGAGGLLPESGS